MSILVTGGDGFVGQHLLARLVETGAEITATTVAPRPRPGTLEPAGSARVAWHRVDVLDDGAIAGLFRTTRPERIFHLAGLSSSAGARERPAEALRVNAEGTLRLLDAAAASGVSGPIVVAGSADAYGRPPDSGSIDEELPLRPVTAYGTSKAAQEIVALGVARARGLDVRIARLFPLVGPGQGAAFVVPSFCRRALRIARDPGAGPFRAGNLDVERDFTDVRDGVEALWRLASAAVGEARAFNVCSGRGTPIRRLLDWVMEAAGVDAEVLVDPELARPDEPRRVVGDPGRLRRATGWAVERDLQAAVRDTFRRVRAEEGADAPSDRRNPG